MSRKVKLHLGDCMDYLHTMPDQSVDLTFVDPPYNVGKDYGEYKDDLSDVDYFIWCKKWLAEIKRVSKRIAVYPPKKHLLWFWNELPESYLLICGWSPEGAIRGRFVHHYVPLLVPANPVKRIKDLWYNVQVPGLGYFYREKNWGNPGQTSMDITNRVIDAFSVQGETVLDCFMGVGTTGVVCAGFQRNFIGVELNQKYYDIAVARIEEACAQTKLPLDINVESETAEREQKQLF